MLRKGPLIALGIIVFSNAAALGLAALNRSGEPEATLRLTERELRLPARGMETTGVSLWLGWDRPYDVDRDDVRLYSWFDRAKLESIGFDCSVAPDSAGAQDHYEFIRQPARFVYAVLEYRPNEPASAMGEPSQTAPAEGPPLPAREPLTEADRARLSRLVPIDVGLDPDALRTRYPDRQRFAILQAGARVVYEEATIRRPARLTGALTYVMPRQVFVPKHRRALLDRLVAGQPADASPGRHLDHDPRYEVTLKVGRNLQPWVDAVTAIR